jgi:hypothetical protein
MRRLLAALSLLAAVPAMASAQSLFGTHGLGIPIEGLDARGRALGVNGVGLLGLSTGMLNPAEPAGLLRRGVTASFQPWGGSVELNGEEGDVGGTRFPLIAVQYPIGRIAFSLGYSGLLDQSWAISAEGEHVLGNDTVATTDLVRSTGGLGQLKLGAGYYINARLSVGASVGIHTGSVDRTITRQFPDTADALRTFQTRSRWDYSGPIASVGVRWDPIPEMRVGASVIWSGTLDAEPQEGSTSAHSYDMPLRIAAGVSGRVGPRLLLTFSTTISNYDESVSYSAPGTTVPTVAKRTIDFGGGVEWSQLRRGDRTFPLRAGFRRTMLPFHNEDEEAPTEWAASGGIGLRLVEDDFGPLAVADLGFESGKRTGWEGARTGDGLAENFWRFTVSVSLFGR